MIRLSENVKDHWWHRLYLVIMWPFAVISPFIAIFNWIAFKHDKALSLKNDSVGLRYFETAAYNANLIHKDLAYFFFFLLAAPSLFVLYRVVLFIALGNKAFASKKDSAGS